MNDFWQSMGMPTETPADRLAYVLADEDAQLKIDLVSSRERRGMLQQDVADCLGVTQATISAFERYDNDPKLSTIRRYALAIGAMVTHSVELVDDLDHYSALWSGTGGIVLKPRSVSSRPKSDWVKAS